MRRLTVAVVVALALSVTATAHAKDHRRAVVRPFNAWLNQVAQCESGGRWHINTGNGYFGGLQFSLRSWRGVGGHGYPHQASRLEQKYRGVLLLRLQGRSAWPVCGVR